MNSFTFRELTDIEVFDPTILYPETPFTQASFYGLWQKALGRTVVRCVVEQGGVAVAYMQAIRYPLIFGKSYLYAPHGPVVPHASPELLQFLKDELKKVAHRLGAVFIRLDFSPALPPQTLSSFFICSARATYHSAFFQPRAEWCLDITPPEEEILAGIHEKNRYSIRLASRREVTNEIVTKDFMKYFEIFYALMSGTAERGGFSLHSKDYYRTIFEHLHETPAYLSLGRLGDNVIAIDLMVAYGNEVYYVFGASDSAERNRVPTYLTQWESIRHARSLGMHRYNFGGISQGSTYKGWDGITLFKKRFGGYEVTHSDFFDLVVSPFWYYLYTIRKILKKIKQ